MVKLTRKGLPRKKTNPNPSPATRWKKGQSGNPRKINMRIAAENIVKKEIKIYTRVLIAETYNKYINCSEQELRDAFTNKDLPAIEGIVAGALLKDRLSGELINTEIILDRTIGKVPNVTELGSIGGGSLTPPVINFISVNPGDKNSEKIAIESPAKPVEMPENSSANAENQKDPSSNVENPNVPTFVPVDANPT